MWRTHLIFAGAALVASQGTPVFAKSPHTECVAGQYTILALPLRPAAISDSGQVAGTTANHRAASWTVKQGLREIPLPDGFSDAEAVAINRRGHIAGNAHDRSLAKSEAFLYADGRVAALSGGQSRAYGINDADVVVGASLGADGSTMQPVSWTRNVAKQLAPCCGGAATGINQSGAAIGVLYDAKARYHGFLWQTGGLLQLGPPDRFSTAIVMNDHAHVVLQAFSDVYLYADGNLARLGLHSTYPSKPLAINDCDVIVGAYGPYSDADRAFIWEKSLGFQDLNTRIPADSGWKLEAATGINNQGMIVGRGDFKGEDDLGFLLIPAQ